MLEGKYDEGPGDGEPEDVSAVVGLHVLGGDVPHYGAVAGGGGSAFLGLGAKIDAQNEKECEENARSQLDNFGFSIGLGGFLVECVKRCGCGRLGVGGVHEGEFGEEDTSEEGRRLPAGCLVAPVYEVGEDGEFHPGFRTSDTEDDGEDQHRAHPFDRYCP